MQCAIETQEQLRARNEGLPEGGGILFRIGINLGDVIEEKGNVYGDGVNVAVGLKGSPTRKASASPGASTIM